MSEFLVRNWNVAIPEVDVGDDVFVIRDSDFNAFRVQVKAANSKPRRGGFAAQFFLRLQQLSTPSQPELWYVLAVRHEGQWRHFIVVPRTDLDRLYSVDGVGTPTPRSRPTGLLLATGTASDSRQAARMRRGAPAQG
jgi:hypothetical protein